MWEAGARRTSAGLQGVGERARSRAGTARGLVGAMRGASSLLPQYMCALCKSTGRYPENTKGGQQQDGDKGTAARDYGKGGKQGGDARKRNVG